MQYQILEHGTGLKLCVLNAIAGVGNDAKERGIFQAILQNKRIDFYPCEHCYYVVIGEKYDILFKDISILKGPRHGVFFETADGERIEVNRQNFYITCKAKSCVDPEAWVQQYVPRPPKKERKPETTSPKFKLVIKNEREYYD